MTCFSKISLKMTKIGFSMTMFKTNGSGLSRMNLRTLLQRRSFKEEKLRCVFILIFLKLQSDTQCRLKLPTATTCARKSSKNRPALVNRRNVFSSLITQGSIQQELSEKMDLDWSVLPHPPYLPKFATSLI